MLPIEIRGYVATSLSRPAEGFGLNVVKPPEAPSIAPIVVFEQQRPLITMQAGKGNTTAEAIAILAENQLRAAVQDITEHPETDPDAAKATLQANKARADSARKVANAASQSQNQG